MKDADNAHTAQEKLIMRKALASQIRFEAE